MSKRKYWGRFTAMGLAGLTAMSTMAIVAQAEAYSSNIYEFGYAGIAKTQIKYDVLGATLRTYTPFADQDAAQAVFNKTKGFKFQLGTFYTKFYNVGAAAVLTNNKDFSTTEWTYNDVDLYTGTATPIVPEDYLLNRKTGGAIASTGEVYTFKTKSERDAAITKIANANKSEYNSKYSGASKRLGDDLASVRKGLSDHLTTMVTNEYNRVVAAGYNVNTSPIGNVGAQTITDATALANWKKAADKWVSDYMADIDKDIAKIKEEFTAAYKTDNWGFGYITNTSYPVPFLVNDTKTAVVTQTMGDYITSYEHDSAIGGYSNLDLRTARYRTTDYYNSSDHSQYAFAGEVIDDNTAKETVNIQVITGYNLNTDRWQPMSRIIEGTVTDNTNSTEGGSKPASSTTSSGTITNTTPTTNTTTYTPNVYYNSATGRYYPTQTSAAAANTTGTVSSGYTNTSGSYFNTYTGRYYSTIQEAYQATGNIGDVLTANGATVVINTNNSGDPYYWYFLNRTPSTTSTTSTVPAGSPAIYGTNKAAYAGWNNITSYINKQKSGTGVKIAMHNATEVPASVISAAKNKGVTLQLVNSNGSSWTISPANVLAAKTLDTNVKYNVSDIKSSLVKKAKKVNKGTVSTAQVRVGGTSGTLGLTAGVTVKLPAKRSGCTVKAYRLNGTKLSLASTSKVQSTGAVTLNLDKAGSYLLVVID